MAVDLKFIVVEMPQIPHFPENNGEFHVAVYGKLKPQADVRFQVCFSPHVIGNWWNTHHTYCHALF